jgi:hypothetical protein
MRLAMLYVVLCIHNSNNRLKLHSGGIKMKRTVSNQFVLVFIQSILMVAFHTVSPADAIGSCAVPVNIIEAENCKPGNPSSEWDIAGAGDLSIQGFATDISVNKAETVRFKVQTDASSFRIDIYRIGYYGGSGARKVATVLPSATLPQTQPACINDTATKLTDCGNWVESASWEVPEDSISGVYIAKLVREDTGGASHIVFIVRDDSGGSDLLFKTSDTTWQAYNSFGLGFIEYPDYGYPSQKATKASYNRPFLTRADNSGLGAYNWFFQSEYPMIRWLEANGYNVSYFSSLDVDRRGAEILKHKVLLSVGHDEYWSGQMRSNVESARAAGVNLAFFSGNSIYRKIRWENSIDGSGTPFRTMVCYDESNAPFPTDPADPPIWTGTWRNPTFSPPADGGRPENALSGTLFTVSDGPNELGISLSVPQTNGRMRFWRNTAAASLASGQIVSLGDRVVGYEFDEDIDNGYRPAGLMQLSSTSTQVDGKLLGNNVNIAADVYLPGTATHVMTLYRAASNALVFSAGTVHWSWGLDAQHDNGPSVPDLSMRQSTVNLFADMGVQPVTLQPDLTFAVASTDKTAPVSTITSPASGTAIPAGTLVTITGTAVDSGGGVVGGVDVSTDGGTTWHPATGRESWSYSWSPAGSGTTAILSRAVDDSGNLETPSTAVNVIVTPATQYSYTIWSGATVPDLADGGPDSPVELGVRFSSDVNGSVTGIRFYKASSNTGTHTGNLWTSTGTLLATATFSNETVSGWQQVTFDSPVAITANAVYVASYHAGNGHYSADINYFSGKGMDRTPLHAPASGASGANGLYAYGTTSAFPNQSWNNANYWVDVVVSAPPPATVTSITVTPANPTLSAGATQQFTATGLFSDGSSQNITSLVTWVSSNTGVAISTSAGLVTGVSAGSSMITATLSGITSSASLTVKAASLTITTASVPGATLNAFYHYPLAAAGGTLPYIWTLADGTLPAGLTLNNANGTISGIPSIAGSFNLTVQVSDSGNPQQTATKAMSISVTELLKYSIWPETTVPGLIDAGPDSSVELGVKFRSDISGFVTGIRFYKADANIGTHVGNIWKNDGTLLATAVFTGETASGWQQVNFATPVAVSANSVYVASYHTSVGHYSDSLNYFAGKAVDNTPLHALADGVSGYNGVYAYGDSSTFPSQGWKSSNYWVDVVLSSYAPLDMTPPTVTSFTVPAVSATLVVPVTSFSATDNVVVSGYQVNESATAPLPTAAGWSASPPVAYTFATIGDKTLYAWAKDAAGNVSASMNAPLTIPPLDTTPPSVTEFTIPASSSTFTVAITTLSATDNVAVTGYLVNESAATPSLAAVGWSAIAPASYTFTTTGNKTLHAWVRDAAGNVSADSRAVVSLTSDGPILIVSSESNPFSSYYAEIIRTEGLNAFAETDISLLTSQMLAAYDVVILGEISLTTPQATLLSSWVNAGGKLIAMRPDKKLAGVLGLRDKGATISNAYLLVNTSSGPGVGIVNQTIQYHGMADLYTLCGAASIATLYSDASTQTSSPAVTLNSYGANGGQAAAFTYDLARSIVYTRQGNPAWSGQERDGNYPIRSNDLFYGAASLDRQPDWVDLNKVAIPQADEQQRLLANLIIRMNQDKKPLPRFWYFPRSLPAVVVMTGDDHGNNGTSGRFDSYLVASPPNCSVDDWECIRSTSYIFTDTPISNVQASDYNASGFELALHVNTNCADWTPATLESFYASQLSAWDKKFDILPAPTTHRTHCIAWSDYATQPAVELAHGIRLDASYYYYPSAWVADRPGFFTGSGMPMRFADSNGAIIDVFQAATQMTDESGQTFPFTVDTLLDSAIGPDGYFGVFVANMHTDESASSGSDSIVASALARGIPVVSARQLLKWLDGRDTSSFGSLEWNGNVLDFTITVTREATGLVAMVPVIDGQIVTDITCNNSPVSFTMVKIKGIQYARFTALNGAYQVTYAADTSSPTVRGVSPTYGASGVSTVPQVSAAFSELMDPASLTNDTFELRDPANTLVPAAVTYNTTAQKATLEPTVPLTSSTNYTATIKSGANGVKDLAGNPLSSDFSWPFSTIAVSSGSYSLWPGSAVPGLVDSGPDSAVELGVKFSSDISGYITGIRFYKANTNTGTHIGNLWTNSGILLATAPFTSENASGWQQVNFPDSVPISVNTVYVASYHTTAGHYSDDMNYFKNTGFYSPPLHALANGVSGFNGVYAYGSTSSFPNQSWNSSNYWVDVVFSAIPPPTLSFFTVSPGNQRIAIGASQQFTAIGTYSDGSTSNLTSQVTWASDNTSVATITASGLVTAINLGISTISASLNGISANTKMTATDQIGFLSHDMCIFAIDRYCGLTQTWQ